MTEIAALDNLLDVLRADLRGEVVTPERPEYDQARRVWNAMFDDRRPAALLRCADADDVSVAVRHVRDTDLPVAVRGGGHHIAGFGSCDGGFVIDLGAMRAVTLAPDGARAFVQGGATLHDVDTATSRVKRSVPLGLVSPTGVGGLTLSGGIGWLTRRYGYTCDNLVAARVVTAEGEIVRASEDENADLLWALRGGGGNFGIVTDFEYQTHPVESVVVGEAYHLVDEPAQLEDLLRFYRDWTAELPVDATVWGVLERANESHPLPAEDHGRLMLGLMGAYLDGPSDDAERAFAPMLKEREPAFARTTSMRMVELQHLQDTSHTAISGMHSYMKGEMLTELTDRAIPRIVDYAMRLPVGSGAFEIGQLGGALGARSEMDAAVSLRSAQYLAGFSVMSPDGANLEEEITWAREGWATLVDASAGGVYLNFSGEDDTERVLGSLGAGRDAGKRGRLVELKRRYDPHNRFRVNHNIDPTVGA